MVTIRYTHVFDLCMQLALFAGSWYLTCWIVSVLASPYAAISAAGVGAGIPQILFVLTAFAGIIFIFFGWVVLLLKTILNPYLPSYLYLHFVLLTPVSWEEVEALDFLFSADTEARWYPLRELRKLPKELRRETVLKLRKRFATARADADGLSGHDHFRQDIQEGIAPILSIRNILSIAQSLV
jgi:hypothetical protein